MQVKIQNVRLSFPHLWEPQLPPNPKPGDNPKYSASLILDKQTNADAIAAVKDAIVKVGEEKWGAGKFKLKDQSGTAAANINGKGALVKHALRDGAEKEQDGYGETVMFLSASNTIRVPIVDKNPAIPLTKESGRPYAGCTVSAMVRFWAQDNNFGRRINAQLQAIQFVADGEAFGDKPVDAAAVFGNVEDGADPLAPGEDPNDFGTPF